MGVQFMDGGDDGNIVLIINKIQRTLFIIWVRHWDFIVFHKNIHP